MKQRRLHLLLAICALGLACRTPAPADRISIAVVPFGVGRGSSPPPIDVAQVIRADLASSGRFAAMAAADMPSSPTRMADVRFEEWQRAKADYLVVGLVARVHDGGHEVEFRLIDARTQTERVGFLVPSAPDELERTAREIAAIIQQRLTAETGPRDATAPRGSAGR